MLWSLAWLSDTVEIGRSEALEIVDHFVISEAMPLPGIREDGIIF